MKPRTKLVLTIFTLFLLVGVFYPHMPVLVTEYLAPLMYIGTVIIMLVFLRGVKNIWRNLLLMVSVALLPLVEALWFVELGNVSFTALQNIHGDAGNELMFGPLYPINLAMMTMFIPAFIFVIATFMMEDTQEKEVDRATT